MRRRECWSDTSRETPRAPARNVVALGALVVEAGVGDRDRRPPRSGDRKAARRAARQSVLCADWDRCVRRLLLDARAPLAADIGQPSAARGRRLGALTTLFEFSFGRLVAKQSWDELLGAYDIRKGTLSRCSCSGLASAQRWLELGQSAQLASDRTRSPKTRQRRSLSWTRAADSAIRSAARSRSSEVE